MILLWKENTEECKIKNEEMYIKKVPYVSASSLKITKAATKVTYKIRQHELEEVV